MALVSPEQAAYMSVSRMKCAVNSSALRRTAANHSNQDLVALSVSKRRAENIT